jgi:hypothetical protein
MRGCMGVTSTSPSPWTGNQGRARRDSCVPETPTAPGRRRSSRVSGAKRIPGGMGLARTVSGTRPRPRRTEVVFRMRKLARHRSWRAYPGRYDSGTGTQVVTALELAQVWTSCGRRVAGAKIAVGQLQINRPRSSRPRLVTAVRNCPLDRRLWRRPMPYRCTRLIMVPVSDQGRHEHVLQLRGTSLLVGTNRLLGLQYCTAEGGRVGPALLRHKPMFYGDRRGRAERSPRQYYVIARLAVCWRSSHSESFRTAVAESWPNCDGHHDRRSLSSK